MSGVQSLVHKRPRVQTHSALVTVFIQCSGKKQDWFVVNVVDLLETFLLGSATSKAHIVTIILKHLGLT